MSNLGKLYLVGTPIGNLEDITLRALRILKEVELIAAEDTRHTGKLLHHFQITTPQISYHQHNRQQRTQELIDLLQQGKTIALVSDAGMPSISDPGTELVQVCLEHHIEVIPIPGVTAVITALSASGVSTEKFIFEGFLPPKTQARCDRLKLLKNETRTLIFYESPHRLLDTLQDLAKELEPERKIVLARELTKIHEEFWRGSLKSALALYQTERKPKGEYTIVLAGATITNETLSDAEIKQELSELLQQGMSSSQASRHLAEITKLSKNYIYQIAIFLPKN
jgi:16S rRNA (cytidine1402-2'-O)-methyltransferase